MQFPAKITSSCIWVAIPVDWVILHWYACGAERQAADGWVPHFLRYWAILERASSCANNANVDRTELFPNELSALNNLDFWIHWLIAIVSLKPTGVGMWKRVKGRKPIKYGGVELGMQGTGGLRVGPPCPHPHLIRCQILNMSYVMGAKKDGTKAVMISFTLRLL